MLEVAAFALNYPTNGTNKFYSHETATIELKSASNTFHPGWYAFRVHPPPANSALTSFTNAPNLQFTHFTGLGV